MSEIEKLYENCGIKPNHTDECKLVDIYWNNEELADKYGLFDNYIKAKCPHNQECTDECEHAYDKDTYPPFTAEKQLKLIKFLFNHNVYYDVDVKGNYWFHITDDCYTYYYNKFEIALANIINEMWQDLTEEEKDQIRGILE